MCCFLMSFNVLARRQAQCHSPSAGLSELVKFDCGIGVIEYQPITDAQLLVNK